LDLNFTVIEMKKHDVYEPNICMYIKTLIFRGDICIFMLIII
jgi:hypothetical protein